MWDEKRYRLRIKDRIVGYMRKLGGQGYFYSSDSFWWTGKPIEYKSVDEWVGLKDKNANHIFEWDILTFKLDAADSETRNGVVLWQNKSQAFGIYDWEEEVFFPLSLDEDLPLFQGRDLKVYSHLFINPELKNQLGFTDDD